MSDTSTNLSEFSDDEEDNPKPATSRWHRLLRSCSFWLGSGLTAFWLGVALLAPWIAPLDPLANYAPLLPPLSHLETGDIAWLGTDHLGRDGLSRLIFGSRNVIFWSLVATSLSYAVGVTCGLISGYRGGIVDQVMNFFVNIVLSFPVILVYLSIVLLLGSSGINIVIAVVFSNAPLTFRLMRSLVLDIRERDFVSAAVIRGETSRYILFSEILPNTMTPLLVDACLRFGYTAITIGILGFLGLGLPPPTPDWGGIVQEGIPFANVFPHIVIFPCVAISSLVLGANLIADALQETSR